MGGPADVETIRVEKVPARLFLESQDHQHDLIRELQLVDLGGRFQIVDGKVPQELAGLIGDILRKYREVRTATREQALEALERGEDLVDLDVPAQPGMAAALREWLDAVEHADRVCTEGELLQVAAPPAIRELRRWYVEQLTARLPSE